MLEPGDEVVGEAHDDHVAARVPPPPPLGPQVKDVMEVDVRQQRGYRSCGLAGCRAPDDREVGRMVALCALVSGLDAELVRLGYKDSTMVWYRRCWRRLQAYFAACGIEEFSLDAAMAWGDDACGFFAKEQAGTLKPNDIYMFRVAAMLGEYAAHGAVMRRYNRSVRKVDAAGAETVARFQAHLRAAGRAASTVRTYGTVAGEFVAFTGTRGGLGCCDPATIGAFVATLAGYQVKTVEQK